MMTGLEQMKDEQKVRFIQGFLCGAGKGEQLVMDDRIRIFYHVIDALGADLTGAKTIDAIVEWLEKKREKGE